jgi:hypothetical protein
MESRASVLFLLHPCFPTLLFEGERTLNFDIALSVRGRRGGQAWLPSYGCVSLLFVLSPVPLSPSCCVQGQPCCASGTLPTPL